MSTIVSGCVCCSGVINAFIRADSQTIVNPTQTDDLGIRTVPSEDNDDDEPLLYSVPVSAESGTEIILSLRDIDAGL